MDTVQVFYKIPERFPHWPQIDPPFATKSDEMFAKLICHPPLGQPTVLSSTTTNVTFRVALEVKANSEKSWEVLLWHNLEGNWQESTLNQAADPHNILSISSSQNESKVLYFTLNLPRPELKEKTTTQFTIKFRHSSMSRWIWVNEQFNLSDGQLYWQQTFPEAGLIDQFIEGLDPEIKATFQNPETPDTLLWSLSCPVPEAQGTASGSSQRILGRAISSTRWFATCRLYSPWFIPRHGKGRFSVDKDAVQIAFLREDGLSVVLLALSGINDTSVCFRNDESGNVVVNTKNDSPSSSHGIIIVAVAKSFDIANASTLYHARKLSAGTSNTSENNLQAVQKKSDDEAKPTWYEEWVDGFGYCTWNSLGQGLNEQRILDALEAFRKDDVAITTLIVDDNWQSLDNDGQGQGNRGMTDFEADKNAFPNGLKGMVSKIKSQNPTINRVAVWHTMLGYWGAISPNGALAKRYKTVQAMNGWGWKWTCIAPEDINKFYADFYSFLQSCGVDGVKTDSQNSLDDIQEAPDRRSMIKAYQDAWMLQGLRYLNARQISCGSQAPVIMYHSLISKSTPPIVVRNSDDFFPDIESSHAWHIFTNAHNALMMQHFNVLLDWDMFQTDHPWSSYHAAARCISGGPVYITDYPEKHNKALINQMTAMTVRKTTVILRPQRLAKSSQVYNAYDEPKLLRIDTYHGWAETGTSIVGVFNVCQYALTEIICLSDFPGTAVGSYIIRSYVNGKTSIPMTQEDDNSFIHVDLDVKGYDILTAYPVATLNSPKTPLKIANLGLTDKMSGAVAIVATRQFVDGSGRLRIWTSLKALGTFGLWIDNLPSMSVENDIFITMLGLPVPLHCVKICDKDDRILEIDLERTWKEGAYQPGWSNEVVVELMIK